MFWGQPAGRLWDEPVCGGMDVRNSVMMMNELLADIAEMQKPWLAAINGWAAGAAWRWFATWP